ncbi:MAG: hypothetical protein H7A25_18575 [Leptospiraceae bacterium]|nr:hypothetical protein [Leptospiraceae bacterium]MCP5501913.1 hypothetical protein [Leptospiraceae bacterium]
MLYIIVSIALFLYILYYLYRYSKKKEKEYEYGRYSFKSNLSEKDREIRKARAKEIQETRREKQR